ncbi:glycoside hydrolase family 13 protein [Pseudoflavonifractor phocaeensis]|uniref:glycoside hydrolase family 13 protein n=1 Tax=Pseudoflavonifractor phocaeensis TaxID=1870988 RepID=UPI00195A537C|nr:glycoside hydrolase family 13 protein [Pseudoflavonifractor phocaeensis]MBM6938816.1 glycoside hydrolase family 13 protein [Pseudoflavonifractor phocaeensis]
MHDAQIFDPRSTDCKSPYGAVPSGTAVTFTLRPDRSWGFSRVTMLARFESSENRTVERNLHWDGLDGRRDRYNCTLEVGDYVGLVWYSFCMESLDGRRADLGEYQLTVYDDSETVPGWFGEGVTYQIFPDRFRRRTVPSPQGMIGGRSVHTGWREEPAYRPDENGEIRNRDFFGGSLAGVREKLPYLRSLGVDTIYFCPIFEAPENHRYGTGDYEKIDPMLGDEKEFRAMCAEAHDLGMRIMLDGVFNHTGFVSRYFNGDGSYQTQVPGAAQSPDSPYRKWYNFIRWPDQYDSWWGIYSLPAVNESEPSYMDYIIKGENSIIRRWLRAGADGWRLDVADELPDAFVHALHQAVRETKPDAMVIGEVWEDGSSKIAYGVRRKHILGGHCDGLMNYPFRNAAISYLLGGDAKDFMEAMERLRANYPPFAYHSTMNALGTHDTPRILTLLGVGSPCAEQSRDWRASYRMDREQMARGIARLKLGTLILYTFPGSPTVYYGDEAGMEGFEDPFNRRTYPWGEENEALIAWYRMLGQFRHRFTALRRGEITYHTAKGRLLVFRRTFGEEQVVTAVNAGERERRVCLPWAARDLITGETFPRFANGECHVNMPPLTGRLLVPAEE